MNTAWFGVNGIVQNVVASAGNGENGVLGGELQIAHIFLWVFPSERIDKCAESGMDRRFKVRKAPRLEWIRVIQHRMCSDGEF
jgi:hypothetical protein